MLEHVLTARSGYDVSLFLHITAGVIGLGTTFVEGLTFPVAVYLMVTKPGL